MEVDMGLNALEIGCAERGAILRKDMVFYRKTKGAYTRRGSGRLTMVLEFELEVTSAPQLLASSPMG